MLRNLMKILHGEIAPLKHTEVVEYTRSYGFPFWTPWKVDKILSCEWEKHVLVDNAVCLHAVQIHKLELIPK